MGEQEGKKPLTKKRGKIPHTCVQRESAKKENERNKDKETQKEKENMWDKDESKVAASYNRHRKILQTIWSH